MRSSEKEIKANRGSECWHGMRSSVALRVRQACTKGKASMQSSRDAHRSSHDTHGIEGAWGVTLEAKQDQSGRSLPYIGTEALGSKPPNWSATRSPMAIGVLIRIDS